MITTILVASTSNSLGRKSNVLFVMTACVVATTGFARPRAAARSGLAMAAASTSVAMAGAGGLRPLGAVVAARRADGDAETDSFAGPAGLNPGGLRRSPAQPDRALRSLRLTAARS